MIRSTAPINDEMAHQLYVLQVLTFNLLEDRMMTKMDPQDQVGTETGVGPTAAGNTQPALVQKKFCSFRAEVGCKCA